MDVSSAMLGLFMACCIFLFPVYFLALGWNLLFRKRAINPWSPVLVVGLFFLYALLSQKGDPDEGLGWALTAVFLVPLIFVINRWRRYRELKNPDLEVKVEL